MRCLRFMPHFPADSLNHHVRNGCSLLYLAKSMEKYLKNVHDFCNCLKILTNIDSDTVEEAKASTSKSEAPTLESALQKRINNILENIHKYSVVDKHIQDLAPFLKELAFCQESITWAFVLWISVLLFGVQQQLDLAKKEKLTKNAVEIDQLSVKDQQIFICGVQFIIRVGLCPSLIPGLRMRSTNPSSVTKENLSYYESYRRLVFTLVTLLSVTNHPQLKALIVTKHFIDLLVGLVQICHAPIKKYQKLDSSTPNVDLKKEGHRKKIIQEVLSNFSNDNVKSLLFIYKSKYEGSEYELIREMEIDRIEFNPVFERLQVSVLQSILIRDLLDLQRFSKVSNLKWLNHLCGKLLSAALLRRNGLGAVIEGILPNICDLTSNEASNSDYVKLENIAKLISQPPSQCDSIENYYAKICPQVVEHLGIEEFSTSHVVTKICCSVLNNLMENNFNYCQRYAVKSFTKNLSKAVENGDVSKTIKSGIIIKDKELQKIIVIFSKLLSSSLEVNETLKKDLLQYSYFFFKLYTVIHSGPLHLKNQVKNLLLFWLNNCDNPISMLNCFSFDEFSDLKNQVLPLRENVKFLFGDEGGVRVEIVEENLDSKNSTILIEENEQRLSAIHLLLNEFDKKDIIEEWFMILLEQYSSEMEMSEELSEKEICRNLNLTLLIQHLVEKYDVNLIKNPTKAIAFIRNTLSRSIKIKTDSTLSTQDTSFSDQSTFMGLSILLAVIAQKDRMTNLEWNELKSSCTLLRQIESLYPSTFIAKLSEDIRITIEADPERKPTNKEANSLSPFASAWKNLQDPLLPTVGNALIRLKNLILEKDPEALSKKSTLFNVFEEHLDHEDSYIYLTTIRALSALALTYTDEILPKMASRYADFQSRNDSLEFRLKLGEALVQICKNLGDMAPKYRNILLSSFLVTSKHSDDHLRCSSLSNLGEICKLLKFSLGSNIQEILMCVSSLSSDSNVEVRRSSCMVLTLLLRGLSKETFPALEKELLQIYRHLKKVYHTEVDDVTKLHAQEALYEINQVVKSILTPDSNFTKEFRILDLS